MDAGTMTTLRRLGAAFFTPTGGKGPSQPAVWAVRSTGHEDSVSPPNTPSDARRMA